MPLGSWHTIIHNMTSMTFNSFTFLWLFPLIFIVYYFILKIDDKGRLSNFLLLFISYALYAKSNPVWCLYLLAITAITYIFARIIENNKLTENDNILLLEQY